VALTVAVATGLFFIFALSMALKTRMTKPTTGREGLIDAKGVSISPISQKSEGDVKIKGEIWKATSHDKIRKGDKIQVVNVDGLILQVKKIDNNVQA
jgi:membrane-bound serine protease (ClpP class)